MDALGLLRETNPRAALEALKQEVRKAPREARLRTFLFQLFCVLGEWDRALTQLTVAAELDPIALPMAEAYRAVIRCEVLRASVFAGIRTPLVFGHPDPWIPLLIEANRALARGDTAAAAGLRDAAFEQAPASSGTVDGSAFEWIADADPRLGPVLEAIIDGKYYWVPFGNVASISIEAPVDLRDQVWMPAEFHWANGGESVGFIPTRYPGSAEADAGCAMARRTEWVEQGAPDDGWVLGLGQRMFATDTGEMPLLDIRELTITPLPGDPSSTPADHAIAASEA